MYLVYEILFGTSGNDADHLGVGWSNAEPGFRRTLGSSAAIWLENPGSGDGFLLKLELHALGASSNTPRPCFEVEVHGAIIGRSRMPEAGEVEHRIPAELLPMEGPIRVVLRCHTEMAGHGISFSMRRISLHRLTLQSGPQRLAGSGGISVSQMQAATGIPASQFMRKFESLGENCEFGLVQRRCDAEPLGLLRFSYIEKPDLLLGLRNRFQGLGKIENLEISFSEENPPQYNVTDKIFALFTHTGQYQNEVDEETVLKVQSKRFHMLARNLLIDLTSGEKIFILKHNETLNVAQVLPIFVAMNEFGANTLLWVVNTDTHQPGTVECILPGLLKGYIGRFAPYESANDFDFEAWLELAANAYRLQKLTAPGLFQSVHKAENIRL